MPKFDAAQAQKLGRRIAEVYEHAQAEFSLTALDVAKSAIGAALGFAYRAGMQESDVHELIRSYWRRVGGSLGS